MRVERQEHALAAAATAYEMALELDRTKAEAMAIAVKLLTGLADTAPAGATGSEPVEEMEAENARLRAALSEAADELDEYYRREHPEADRYPDERRKLERAMASNPARMGLGGAGEEKGRRGGGEKGGQKRDERQIDLEEWLAETKERGADLIERETRG